MELLDFTLFLEAKALQELVETAITSETSLMNDWIRLGRICEKKWQGVYPPFTIRILR